MLPMLQQEKQCAADKRERLQRLQVSRIRNLLQYTIISTVKANI